MPTIRSISSDLAESPSGKDRAARRLKRQRHRFRERWLRAEGMLDHENNGACARGQPHHFTRRVRSRIDKMVHAFKTMGATRSELDREYKRLRADKDYYDDWCRTMAM